MKINKLLGYVLIICGISLFVFEAIVSEDEIIIENNKISYSLAKEVSYKYIDNHDLYDAILSIPQLNLKKGIYKKDDIKNNIENNVTIHADSDYPDIDNSNVILLAHSGSGKKAFFKDLYKLNFDSLIEFYYNHVKYVYKIDNYYNVLKNGEIKIFRDRNKKSITLITCNQVNKNEQLVYIGYLIDEVRY